jgi:hypothetical protein
MTFSFSSLISLLLAVLPKGDDIRFDISNNVACPACLYFATIAIEE